MDDSWKKSITPLILLGFLLFLAETHVPTVAELPLGFAWELKTLFFMPGFVISEVCTGDKLLG